MSEETSRFVRVILIPAAVFQAVIFGGAYGTGREVAEFISVLGPVDGLLALCVAGLGWGLTMALSFELARLRQAYDYRGFLKVVIGPAWIAFELLFLISLLIVLAVNGSAAGSVLNDQFGIPPLVGVGLLFFAVVALNYFGRTLLEDTMSICMIALSIVLVVYSVLTFVQFHDAIVLTFSEAPSSGNWWINGLQFMLYTAAVIPVLLYSARSIHTRSEAILSGFTAGFVGIFPALVFHLTFMATYPMSLEQPLPTYWMIGQLDSALADDRLHRCIVCDGHTDLCWLASGCQRTTRCVAYGAPRSRVRRENPCRCVPAPRLSSVCFWRASE